MHWTNKSGPIENSIVLSAFVLLVPLLCACTRSESSTNKTSGSEVAVSSQVAITGAVDKSYTPEEVSAFKTADHVPK